MERNFFKDSLDALKRFVDEEHNGNINSASESLGMTGDTLYKWLKEKRSPKLEIIGPILDKLGFCVDRLPQMGGVLPFSKVEVVQGDDLQRIPIVGEAGAGTPAEFFNSEPESWLPVLPLYFFPGLRAIKVIGDSMEPTIMKGSYVGVIPFSGRLSEGAIYLVEDPDFGLVVKRVRKDRAGTLMLFSDNPSWEPIPMPYEGYDHIIAGEVCWVWQMLR